MAEPASTATTVSLGLASGIVSALMVALGLTGQVVVWAMIGCVIGVSWAPRMSRLRGLLLFLCSTLASAKAGSAAAELWYQQAHQAAGGLALLLGIFFHPLSAAVVKRLPTIIEKRTTQ